MPATQIKLGRRQFSVILIASVLIAGLIGLAFLGRQVARDLLEQSSAQNDNMQFTLSQVEVDFLKFQNELEQFDGDPQAMSELRRRFDIFFSRIDMMHRARQFQGFREIESWRQSLNEVDGFLKTATPLIDGPEQALLAEHERFRESTSAISSDIRNLSISALAFYASRSDALRQGSFDTLSRLTNLTVALLAALAALSTFLFLVNRTMMARGAALGQANLRMNKILSTALDGVIVVNDAGLVQEFNPAAEAIFGYSALEAKGRSIGELIVPDDLRAGHDAGMARFRQGSGRAVIGKGRVQMEAKRANGEVFPVEIALQTAFDRGEQIVIGFVRDISERMRARQEIIEARDRALAGEKAKADFLTVMSHEIRTPLNGLLGNLSLLHDLNINEAHSKIVQNMDISGKVLQGHVDSVLDIARFEAGKMEPLLTAVDLNRLLQELVDAQATNAAHQGNTIAWSWVGAPSPYVTTDEQRLRQVLLNLVGNAIKFTRDGSISVEVELSETVPGSDIAVFEFRVIDDGAGISEDDQTRIFKDFETSDASLERQVEGTGLGLAICRRIISMLGGEIGVESLPGEGSVFWFRLNLELRHEPGPSRKTKTYAPSWKPMNVLVVEDNAINLELVESMLRRDGHHVTSATDGKSGVAQADAQRFDLIFMDISMPIMDGLAATQKIREGQGLSCDTPIIALSANVLPNAVERFRSSGMNSFLGKPIKLENLRAAMASVLGGGWVSSVTSLQSDQLSEVGEEVGAEKLHSLLAAFSAEIDAALSEGRGLDWQDAETSTQFARDCHRLAGSAAVFGLSDLRAALVAVEQGITDGQTLSALSRLSHADQVWQRDRKTLSLH